MEKDLIVGFARAEPSIPLPNKSHVLDAAYDLRSLGDHLIDPGRRMLITTGLSLEIPAGVVGLVLPRSGLALNHGVTVLNSPGCIDPGYTGDVGVVLINFGEAPFAVASGDRIAQILLVHSLNIVWELKQDTVESERGPRGFGSTGISE